MDDRAEERLAKRVTDWGRTEKPKLRLIGEDGNAFAILGRAFRAAREAGWSREQFDAYKASATSGDYDNLLRVTMEFFDVE